MIAPLLDLLDTFDWMSPKALQDFLGRAEDEEGPEVVMSPDSNWTPAELAAVIITTVGILAGERVDDYEGLTWDGKSPILIDTVSGREMIRNFKKGSGRVA